MRGTSLVRSNDDRTAGRHFEHLRFLGCKLGDHAGFFRRGSFGLDEGVLEEVPEESVDDRFKRELLADG